MYRRFLAILLALVALTSGCGAPRGQGTTAARLHVPEQVDEASYRESIRMLAELPLDSPDRGPLRERILAYLAGRTDAIVRAGDYDQIVAHFGAMTALFTPDELGSGDLSPALEAPARAVLARARPLGDEARALSALLVLHRLHPDRKGYERRYREVARWGRRARATLPDPIERTSRLIDVWEGHAELTPAPPVLDTLAGLYVQRRDAVVDALRSGEGLRVGNPFGNDFGLAPAQLLRQAPFEVAAVYLAHGNVAEAITHLKAMGQVTDLEAQLLRVLDDARAEGAEGADALQQLADAYREARPDVASGICTLGLRQMPDDPRFPTCLARVAAEEERYPDATAWYAEAIERAPSQRALYDEALKKINEFIERGLYDSDPAEARRLAAQAEQILAQRASRWPESPPPVGSDQLDLLIGTLETNAGNVAEARRRLEQSLEEKVTPAALVQLATLELRTDHPARAAELYTRALEQAPDESPSDIFQRAQIEEQLGDAHRMLGDTVKARAAYGQALQGLDRAEPHAEGPPLALIQVHRGVVLDRLGRGDEAKSAFEAAMGAAPHWRDTYAGILSHLAVASPDPALATRVFRRAQRQLTLDPEWKVYFALWVQLVAGRAGVAPEPDVVELLRELARGTAWWARLAKLGAGQLPADELIGDAKTTGQRAEAYFYAGARRLAAGDEPGARELFGRVVGTHMVSFFEYVMAQQLRSELAADR